MTIVRPTNARSGGCDAGFSLCAHTLEGIIELVWTQIGMQTHAIHGVQASIGNHGIADASLEGLIATSPLQDSDDLFMFKMSAHQNTSRSLYSYNRALKQFCC